MTHDEAVRMKFAYLAGLIKGDEREKLKALYEADHKKHAKVRADWCPMCEMREIEAMLDRPSIYERLTKKR